MDDLKIAYQNRIVFFFDILGFRDLVQKQVEKNGEDCSTIFNIFEFINKFYEDEIDDKYSESKQITFFSDCVIISFVEEEPDEVFLTIHNLQILLINLVHKSIVIRGGISYGKLFHTEKYLFGPAFIDAYLIEKDIAKCPRIICDDSILLLSQRDKSLSSAKQDLEVMTHIIRRDVDNYWYIDYIENVESQFNDNYEEISYYLTLEKLITFNLSNTEKDIVKKYIWMRDKYNNKVSSIIENNEKGRIKDEELSHFITQLKIIE